jgi:3-oxoacyl-[acyl-carrier protein] reductase
MADLTHRTAMVVGGSRGLGLGVTTALRDNGARVIVVARDVAPLAGLDVHTEPADATDADTTERLLAEHRPDLVVLTAGTVPPTRPLHEHTWETFSANWHGDVRIAFTWLRAVLRTPPTPRVRVIVFGSAAELRGSPLSGGYAGAKATVRQITAYARAEAADGGPTFVTVLPTLAPATAVGRAAVQAYADREGSTPADFVARLGTPLTPHLAGAAVADLATMSDADLAPAYLLGGNGLQAL